MVLKTIPSKGRIKQMARGELPLLYSALELIVGGPSNNTRKEDNFQWLLDFVERHESLKEVKFQFHFLEENPAFVEGNNVQLLGVLQGVARLCARLGKKMKLDLYFHFFPPFGECGRVPGAELANQNYSVLSSMFLGSASADYRFVFSSVCMTSIGIPKPLKLEPVASAVINQVVSLPNLEHVQLKLAAEDASHVLKISKLYANTSGRCDPFAGFGMSPECEIKCSYIDVANMPLFECHKSLIDVSIYRDLGGQDLRVMVPFLGQGSNLQVISMRSDVLEQNEDLLLALLQGNKKLRQLTLHDRLPQGPQVWRRILLDSPTLECLELCIDGNEPLLPRDDVQSAFRHTQLRRLCLRVGFQEREENWGLVSLLDILALRPTGTPLQELQINSDELPFPDPQKDDQHTQERKGICLASMVNLMRQGSFTTVKLFPYELLPQALETVIAGVRDSQHLQDFELSIPFGLTPAIMEVLETALPALPPQLVNLKLGNSRALSNEYPRSDVVPDSTRFLGSFLTAVAQSQHLESFEIYTGLAADVEVNVTAKVGIIINQARRMGTISPDDVLKIMAETDLAVAPLSADKQSFLQTKVSNFCLSRNPGLVDPRHGHMN